jgi:hypothetical protein
MESDTLGRPHAYRAQYDDECQGGSGENKGVYRIDFFAECGGMGAGARQGRAC